MRRARAEGSGASRELHDIVEWAVESRADRNVSVQSGTVAHGVNGIATMSCCATEATTVIV